MTDKSIEHQKRVIERIKKEFEPLKKTESEACRLWALGYHKMLAAKKKLDDRRKKGLTTDPVKKGVVNKAVQRLWDIMDGWDERSIELTKQRDDAREAMEKKKQEILVEEQLLKTMVHEYEIQMQQTDGMVERVFILNDGVVAALENMDKYLTANIFPQLHEKGTQKAIENSTSTRKVVIMTNSITVMDVSMVEEAKHEIDIFFARINPTKEVRPQDETIAMLSDLLKELLVVKIRVKAGPNFSRFLAMEINAEKFPELKRAQRLLASSTNYSRSGLYVRLFTRETKEEKWQPVRQS